MSATLVVLAIPNPAARDAEREYLAGVLPMLERAGGRDARRLRVDGILAGNADYSRLLVMEFPSAEMLRALFESAEYQALVPLRNRAFVRIDMLVAQALDGQQAG